VAQPDLITSPPLRVVAPKPKLTIYYALLIIALLSMLIACLFLYLEIRRFGGFGAVQGRVSSADHSPVPIHEGAQRGHRVNLAKVSAGNAAVDS
jgi:hypothetical protein